jgi:hypothetical protein
MRARSTARAGVTEGDVAASVATAVMLAGSDRAEPGTLPR